MARFLRLLRPTGLAALLLSPLSGGCGIPDSSDDSGADTSPTTTSGSTDTSSATSGEEPTGSGDASGATGPTDGGSTGGGGSQASGSSTGDGATDGATGGTTLGETTMEVGTTMEFDTTTGGGEPGVPVDLGTAEDYVILAKTAISTTPNSAITGDVGLSPAAASYITGFSLIADPTNVYSTSTQVVGKVYAADYEPPTPSKLTTAVGDMELAFTDAAARAPDVIELGAGDIGGMTLPAGVYKWSSSLLIPSDLTLDGTANDVWIFQIASDLTLGSGTEVALTGGAQPRNVFWQVSGLVDLGPTAHLEGVVLTQTSITLKGGASLTGRLLAQTAVVLGGSTITAPAP